MDPTGERILMAGGFVFESIIADPTPKEGIRHSGRAA